MIQYLPHTEIDRAKWDLCLEQAPNSFIYGYSWYLDEVSAGWEALVLDDYRAVMPLTQHKKYGIRYLSQPFFTQQLGIFSKQALSQGELAAFIEAIPAKFRFIEIHLNEHNQILDESIKIRKRKNYVLELNKSYEKIQKGYNSQAKRNLKQAKKNSLELKAIGQEEVILFYKQHKALSTKGVKETDYKRLLQLMQKAYDKGKLLCKGVYAKSGELLAAGAFLAHKNRLIFLLGNASDSGKETGAMTYLMDCLIFQFAGHQMLFDFEGSEIEGIARFFKSFGSEKRNYYKYKRNNLPWLLRLFKS